jgi:hypothetical protein
VQPEGDYIVLPGNHYFIDLVYKLIIAGYPFTEEELTIVKGFDKIELSAIRNSYSKFLGDHLTQINDFLGKHSDIIVKARTGNNDLSNLLSSMIYYIKENMVPLSDEEKAFIDEYQDSQNSEVNALYRDFYNKWGSRIHRLSLDYKDIFNVKYYVAGALKRKDSFQNELEIGPCMAIDVMLAQNIYETIFEDTQYSLLSDNQKISILQYFSTQYMSDYFSRFLEFRFFNAGIK